MNGSRVRRVWKIALIVLAGLSGGRVRAQQPAPAGVAGISASAIAQMRAIVSDKASRTPAQRKIDSQILYVIKQRTGRLAPGMPVMTPRIPGLAGAQITVDVRLTTTATAVAGAFAGLGASVVYADAGPGFVRLTLPLTSVEALAALPSVVSIRPQQRALYSRMNPADGRGSGPGDRVRQLSRARLARSIEDAVRQWGPITNTGSQESQGDATHQAALARTNFSIDGTGVKIGVISDGVDHLAQSQGLGDLGPVTVLPNQAGSGDEGTAMLEVIHDLAPGARLFFATADPTERQFAQNIRDLRSAGCDIIVDDVFYLSESPFHDGQPDINTSFIDAAVIIQAVQDVTASGALYFSSAGNEGNVADGTSGTWEGNYVDGGTVEGVGHLHNFGGGQTWDVINQVGIFTVLWWDDPLGSAARDDYDLYLLDSTGTNVLQSSAIHQNGTADPVEAFEPDSPGERLVVVNCNTGGGDTCDGSAAPVYLGLYTFRGRLSIATGGATHGHSQAAAAYSVAATPAATAFGPPTPNGPFPNPFNAGDQIENFVADGPRRVFYDQSNSPYTPGNLLSTGGILRQKPDITAADGVSVTGVGGFPNPFYGTSAAAPHAAAIAALIKSRNFNLTPAQIRTALTSTAVDIMSAGADSDSGAGIIMANAAVASVPAPTSTLTRAPAVLNFGATKNGPAGDLVSVTPAQSVTVGYAGATPTWTASADVSWLQISNGSQTGLHAFTVAVVNPGNVIGGSTTLTGTITISAPTANPVAVPVTLTVEQVGASTPAFGEVDTPAQNATGQQAAIVFTGWALDDIGVAGVAIYRNCFPAFDDPNSCLMVGGNNVVPVGSANFVPGARPDVERTYPGYPDNYRAGWGLLIMSNLLPDVPRSQVHGGQGTMQLYAFATDQEGNVTLLGRSTIDNTPTTVTLDNENIAIPFGNLDTPAQGGTVSGTVPIFGWVLTPDTDTIAGNGDIQMATDGSGVVVVIDGGTGSQVTLGPMTYNQCRGNVGTPPPAGVYCDDDVANSFGNLAPADPNTPRTSNPTKFRNLDAGRGAIGAILLDTTTLTNGQHTISIVATDSANRANGIGSRFFTVANGGGGAGLSSEEVQALQVAPAKSRGSASSVNALPVSGRPLSVRTGFNLSAPATPLGPSSSGIRSVTIPVLGRLELSFAAPVTGGYLITNGQLRDLPIGSHLDTATGVFTWGPPAGYVGTYRLTFIVGGQRVVVDVTVN